MRQHVIIGRFGPLDLVPVSTGSDEVATQLDLVASRTRLGHGLGQALDDLRALDVFPTETGLDIAVLAALVHAADTRISRETESQDTWTREMRLVVPVGNPQRWAATAPLLTRMLDFLTGDRWTIGFRARPASFAAVVPLHKGHRGAARFDGLSLFSGGLDSLIGAIDLIESGRTPLFVSHVGEGATSSAQHSSYRALKAHYRAKSFERLRVWMNFPHGLVQDVKSESTTRGRSFLFFALGVFAGTGLEEPFTLGAPENGLIALNVPLDPLRLGSNSTRTTHPFYIACWNDLLDALGIQGRIENPYWDKTKGEMVAACANPQLLQDLTPGTLSCSSPTKGRWQRRGIEHCGYCLPCLIRRAALDAAWGSGADPTPYTLDDLHARTLNTLEAEGSQVRSFQVAIARLMARPGDARFLIHKPGPLPQDSIRLDALTGVYGRGLEEVGALLAGVRAGPV